MIVGGIFCDLSKDFDCANHNILLTKLEPISYAAMCWITIFLCVMIHVTSSLHVFWQRDKIRTQTTSGSRQTCYIVILYCFRQSPTDVPLKNNVEGLPAQLGGITQIVDSGYIYFKGL
jgi:hypothetical protein